MCKAFCHITVSNTLKSMFIATNVTRNIGMWTVFIHRYRKYWNNFISLSKHFQMFLILFHWKTLCKDENYCAFESTFLTILIISLFISMKQYNKKTWKALFWCFWMASTSMSVILPRKANQGMKHLACNWTFQSGYLH